MNKLSKILLLLFSMILIGLLAYAGYFIYYRKDSIKNIINNNLPGKLVGPESPNKAKELKAEEIINWTNYYRKQEGLQELTFNLKLEDAAETKVDDMFEKSYFDHVSPTGVTPAQVVEKAGYKFKVTGENLALGDFLDEKDLVDAWMASPGHRANILNKDYTEIGVASKLENYPERSITWISVQEFGKPQPVCQKPSTELETEIKSKNDEYKQMLNDFETLNAQANQKIQQGNDIYKETKDYDKAEPYYNEGKTLRDRANQKKSDLDSLSKEIENLTNTYNKQVDTYNTCISS